ncbi:unnamed protein product [Prorocentrum cordatum]|uniref:Uncharacterized protein n=1 Tax=Prorocentrum cordatum TaxID=2364126 RepID=A0ABN9RN24_9DINO|nr:unnamed protein product [Polarella glacialis]|mmetsp:Transcript_80231/g.212612  ORF Transcript_80231/g.212612 Transcript_80231/m.212612 type:complete len:237 (+) Transcript_80231:81-791(+)
MPCAAGAPALAALLLAAGPLASCTAAAEVLGLAGEALETCSKPGTAMTGFTRDGKCQDLGDDDAGSHHICIQMKSDFCTQTGQPNWCTENQPCMAKDGGTEGECKIGNWCVCQWAFARYIQMAGGCDAIVDLQCDATNLAAVKAYEADAKADKTIQDALDCIKQKCPSTVSSLQGLSDATARPSVASAGGWSSTSAAGALLLVLAAGAAVSLVAARRRGAAPAAACEWSAMSENGL